jgi:hypothetical protein
MDPIALIEGLKNVEYGAVDFKPSTVNVHFKSWPAPGSVKQVISS